MSQINKNFDARELRRIRQFYLTFPIRHIVRPELKKIYDKTQFIYKF